MEVKPPRIYLISTLLDDTISAPTDTRKLLQRLREAEESLREAEESLREAEESLREAEERAAREAERANRAETKRDQAAIERDQAAIERDQEREQTRPITLDEYLEACHNLIYTHLTVESNPSRTTTSSIRTYNKLVPEHLKR
ncbi:unnamed protein product [Clonostachys rhizophaga]|uniref:Uncharacterized protein n=1 Tax=Clonostachys rhizophaga TaxID=160324 RepID=A0A9N9VJQ9_9HYPO|nr:unnamed protein product [Clonostachys rhizophaga]